MTVHVYPYSSSLRDPNAAQLDKASDLGFGIGRHEVGVHPVLGDLRLGHLREHPGRVVITPRRSASDRVAASGNADAGEACRRLGIQRSANGRRPKPGDPMASTQSNVTEAILTAIATPG